VSRLPRPAAAAEVAGIVTRTAAALIDLAVVLAMMGGLLLTVAGLRFAWSPLSFRWPAPSWVLSLGVGALIAAAYLTVAWATSGRTFGAGVLGLRVLSMRRARLGWAHAALRAVLCLLFPPGLLWAAVSRYRRSVQDAVLLTVVVYDWSDDVGMRRPASARYGAFGRT
jgi:uncharacterized RDD family membrane protein YckC